MSELHEHGIDDLRAFGLINQAGGLSAASRRFGVTKAKLSRALSRLEAAAGTPLFDRVGRGLRLTALGERLRPAAERAVSLARDSEELMRTVDGEPSGPLRVAASALSGQQLLAPVIADYAKRYPSVDVTLVVTSHGPDPLNEDLDVVIQIGRPEEPYLIARRIASSPLKLYVGRRRDEAIDLNDPIALETLGRIIIDVANVPEVWLLRATDGRVVAMESKPLVRIGDPTIALGILRSGTGLAFLPEIYGASRVASGDFEVALPDFDGPSIELYASLPPKRASVPAVRAFLDLLIEHIRSIE